MNKYKLVGKGQPVETEEKQDDRVLFNVRFVINANHPLFSWCDEYCHKAKLLKNAATYALRQVLFASWKGFDEGQLHDSQKEIIELFNSHCSMGLDKEGNKKPDLKPLSAKHCNISYARLDKVFKESHNPDYYSGLPVSSSQEVLKEVCGSFKSYKALRKKFLKGEGTQKPSVPGYVKGDAAGFGITNQDAVIRGEELKLPKTDIRLHVGKSTVGKGRLYQVKVTPYYDVYKIELVFLDEDRTAMGLQEAAEANSGNGRILGLDPGVDNFLTAGNNCGLEPFIVNGKVMRRANARFNAENARLRSAAEVCQGVKSTRAIQELWRERDAFFRDQFHKIACHVVGYCLRNRIYTVVYGMNYGWKKNVKIKKAVKQGFCFLAHGRFFDILADHCLKAGIKLIRVEESYTSKSSFLDMDFLPVYGSKPEGWKPSGKRVKRGCYISSDGRMINADVNGACNIIRKAFPDAFDGITDFSYLLDTVDKVTVGSTGASGCPKKKMKARKVWAEKVKLRETA